MNALNTKKRTKSSFWKRILIFSCILLFTTPTFAQNQAIKIKGKSITIKSAFKQIEKQTDLTIAYDESILNINQRIKGEVKSTKLNDVLLEILQDTNTEFIIQNKHIVIRTIRAAQPTNNNQEKTSLPVSRKSSKVIRGRIADTLTGDPIIGASIIEKGTKNGITTDIDGNFSLEVSPNAILKVSYIGYTGQEIAVRDNASFDITLQEEAKGLNEVVVIGYGTKKKANLIGAVSTVTADELKDRPLSNVGQALQGQIPNLNISFASGTPGEATRLNVRGATSIVNTGAPLVLIDGVEGSLDRVNPNDIESVSVLKDAASAAIYGARAGFGVILITTKSSKNGTAKISYSGRYGFSKPTTNTDFITTGYDAARIVDAFNIATNGSSYSNYSPSDYKELELRKNDKTENSERPWVVVGSDGKYRYYGNFDWYNYLFNFDQPAWTHNLNISGGTEKLNYLVSANINNKKGIYALSTDNYSTQTFTGKFSSKVNSWLTLSSTNMLFKSKYKSPGYDYEDGGNFGNLMFHAMPYVMPYNPDGSNVYTYAPSSNKPADGFAAMIRQGDGYAQVNQTQMTSALKAVAHIIEGLDVTGNVSYKRYSREKTFRASGFMYSEKPNVLVEANSGFFGSKLSETNSIAEYYVYDLYATYQKLFNDVHNFNFIAGLNHETGKYKNVGATARLLLSSELDDLSLGTGTASVKGGQYEYALLGYFSRLSYDYAGKYLAEVNMRYDGTSRFPDGNRWGFFPSVALGWRLSEERFFEPVKKTISNLKLRASIGSLGNQVTDGYANPYYPYIRRLQIKPTSDFNYIFDNQLGSYVSLDAPVSGKLTWETIITKNLGLDIGLLNNRLTATVDVYNRETKNMLASSLTLPNVYGYPSPLENNGRLRTNGYEIVLGWNDRVNVANKPFSYGISVSLADNKSKLIEYHGNETKSINSYYEGMEWGEIWGYKIDGIYKTNEEATNRGVDQSFINTRFTSQAGDLIFADIDNNKKINNGKGTADDHGDLVKLGNRLARYYYGLSMNANWSGVDLSMFLQGIGKQNIYPGQNNMMFWGPYSRAYSSFIPVDFEGKVWTDQNVDAYFPRAGADLARNGLPLSYVNSRYLQDLAYCRLKNITIGYSLPDAVTQKMKISKLRFYFSGENLLTWTKLDNKYLDPEQMTTDSNGRVYPYSKTFSFGLDLTF